MEVKLVALTDGEPLQLINHAAKTCYTSALPKINSDLLDIQNQLVKPGHHTTLQHYYATFSIEGVSVGDVTFGLHLNSSFYNADQRSGRYSKMFNKPDLVEISDYIEAYWPEVTLETRDKVLEYIKFCIDTYQEHISNGTETALKMLKQERPFNHELLEKNAPKIAQEQLRLLLPVIFPTALDYTINLTALASLYFSAWSPVMRQITKLMVEAILENHPELGFIFEIEAVRQYDWSIKLLETQESLKYEPTAKLLAVSDIELFKQPTPDILHPFDKLHFVPEMMNNNIGEISSEIEVSIATMGQDQRHRTLRRSEPKFTGAFYVAPLLKEMHLEKIAQDINNYWLSLKNIIPDSLFAVIAPYGAMVTYKKTGSFNALAHEQAKRLCWCAQEEIYNISRQLREQIKTQYGEKLLTIFEPPCYQAGACPEAARFCGRDMKQRGSEEYFPIRKV